MKKHQTVTDDQLVTYGPLSVRLQSRQRCRSNYDGIISLDVAAPLAVSQREVLRTLWV